MIGLIRIVVSPGAAVPMGTDKNTVFEFWTVAGDDVRSTEHRAVITFEECLLGRDCQPETAELIHNPLGAKVMGLAVHRARAEVTLLLAIAIGTICRKSGTYRLHGNTIVVGSLLTQATGG